MGPGQNYDGDPGPVAPPVFGGTSADGTKFYVYPGDPTERDVWGNPKAMAPTAPTPAAPPPGLQQVTTAPDGVPYYQSSNGNYYTQNPDGTWAQQTIDPAIWNQPPTPPPPPSYGSGGGGGPNPGLPGGALPGGDGLINPWNGGPPPTLPGTSLPDMGMGGGPTFTPPSYTPPPAFKAPTWDEARDDPGFQFVQQQGQKGVERSAAARGVLNSGGTLQDIAQWNQGLADTQYQNVFNRNLNTYQQNYSTQYADPYKFAYQGALDQFTPQQQQWTTNMQAQQRANEFNYLNAYDQYKFGYQRWLDQIHESENLANY